MSTILDRIIDELNAMGAYEQETHGKTEFLEGISYSIAIINKLRNESEGDK